MTSELKAAASRANGAKSHGPKSPETREKSSRNSLTHGFTSKNIVVLECENNDDFQDMLAYYAETYRPGSGVEEALVAEMVASHWRMQRLRMIETALYDREMNAGDAEGNTPEDPGQQLAQAFDRLADGSRAISLASRNESRLHRMHERTHRTLRELQQARKEESAEPVENVQPGGKRGFNSSTTPGPEIKICETNLNTVVKKVPKFLSIVRHRGARRIGAAPLTSRLIKRLRGFEPRKTA
jgi:hypothetical protein